MAGLDAKLVSLGAELTCLITKQDSLLGSLVRRPVAKYKSLRQLAVSQTASQQDLLLARGAFLYGLWHLYPILVTGDSSFLLM